MDLSVLNPFAILLAVMVAATPLLFAALGELVVEKSGVLNLGVEGMMVIGAVAGFVAAVETGNALLGVVAGGLGGAAVSLIFAVLTQLLQANQVASGLGLTLFGLGTAALIGHPYATSGVKRPDMPALEISGLTDRGISIDPLIPLSFLAALALAFWLSRTRSGLILRAVGENHEAAHSLGYNVIRIRVLAIAFGGFMAGIGGAYLSLNRVSQWNENITAGAGWIALAIVVFAAWRPTRAILGAYLFGGVTIVQLNIQALGIDPYLALAILISAAGLLIAAAAGLAYIAKRPFRGLSVTAGVVFGIALLFAAVFWFTDWTLPTQYLSMTPYLVTIAVLVVMSADQTRAALNAPACLGQSFQKPG